LKVERLQRLWFLEVVTGTHRKEEPFMSSVLRPVRRRKKSRRLGEVEVIDRTEYEAMDLDTRVQLILGLIPLGLMHVHELLRDEVKELAGARYTRKNGEEVGCRYGTNPGSVRIGGCNPSVSGLLISEIVFTLEGREKP
jgi:hypothetical protein